MFVLMRAEANLGPLTLGSSPIVVGTLTDRHFLQSFANQTPHAFCDAVELRVDLLGVQSNWVEEGRRMERIGIPAFATLRLGIEGGKWEIHIGGAAGGSVRKADLLCTVDTHDEVLKYMGRFMQYYREHGKYLERTYHFLERIGIETLKQILIEDSEGICARLDADIQAAVEAYKDPWKEAELPAYPGQFSAPELTEALAIAENNG